MNVTRYYPFERNRYFYGKLLTVRDFESEQKYFNNKRRLINRLLHGTGVVSGLHVVAVDDKSVSVEMGFALDHQGREIIVPSPVTLKLSTVEGFSNNEYAKNVYLCIAYDEKGKEPVHSVATSTSRTEEVSEYNRILESYKVFIQEEPPDPSSFELHSLLEDTCIIYEDEQLRILQKTPRYVNPDQEFEVLLKIEKTLQTPKLRFDFEVDVVQFEYMTSGTGGSSDETKITFIEPQAEQKTEYTLSYLLKAKPSAPVMQPLQIGLGADGSLFKGDQQIALDTSSFNTVKVIEGDVKKQVLKDYFSRTLDQSLSSPGESCIYLAKISLLQMGSTYMIEKVEEVPFNEYIHNSSFLYQLEQYDKIRRLYDPMKNKSTNATTSGQQHTLTVKSELKHLEQGDQPHFEVHYLEHANELQFQVGFPKLAAGQEKVHTGVVEIKLGQRGVFLKSKGYYSEEIEHGLGSDGPILIMTGIEEASSGLVRNAKRVFFGDSDVFKDSEYEGDMSNISVGSVLNVEKGTFQIGVRVQGAAPVSKVRIRWWAIKKAVVDTVQSSKKQELHSEVAAASEEDKGTI